MTGSPEIKGIGIAVASAVAFGTLAIFAKFGYRTGADSSALLATRFAIAALLLTVFRLATRGTRRTPRSQVVKLLLLGGFGYAFEASLFFAALEHSDASVVGLVFYSYPVWTAVFGIATGIEPFRPQLLIALALGSLGVALIFSAPSGGLAGPLFALGAAVAVAIYLIAIQVVAADVEPAASALWTSTGAALATSLFALVTGQSLPLDALPAAGALGLASATAFVLLYAAIHLIGSPRAAIAATVEPVTTVVLAALLLDEPIRATIVLGAVLIVSSLPVLALAGGAPHPRPDAAA